MASGTWAPDVHGLLVELGLQQYGQRLTDAGLGTFEALGNATTEQLRSEFGLLPGHARLLQKRLAARNATRAVQPGAAVIPGDVFANSANAPQSVEMQSVSSSSSGQRMKHATTVQRQASAALQSVVGEALTIMKTIMGEGDNDPVNHSAQLETAAFDQVELRRRVAATVVTKAAQQLPLRRRSRSPPRTRTENSTSHPRKKYSLARLLNCLDSKQDFSKGEVRNGTRFGRNGPQLAVVFDVRISAEQVRYFETDGREVFQEVTNDTGAVLEMLKTEGAAQVIRITGLPVAAHASRQMIVAKTLASRAGLLARSRSDGEENI